MTSKRPLIWTYTMLDAYENCNYKGYRKYLAEGDLRVPYVEGKAQAFGNHVHGAFEKRLAHGEPLPADLQSHEDTLSYLALQKAIPEQKLGIRIDGRSCGFHDCGDGDGRGKLDVVILRGPDALIIDYKTSGKVREDPRELAIQALLLKAKYPELRRITAFYYWLCAGGIGKMHDVSDVGTTWRRVQAIVANIRTKLEADWFPKNENPLCPWCEVPYTDCEFRKPLPPGRS